MTVLIIDSNPTSAPPPIPAPTTGPEFHPNAVYRINIDTDGDLQADIAFTFTFSAYQDGAQTGTAWYATGAQARQPEPSGEQLTDSLPVSFDGTARPVQVGGSGTIRLSAALRSDPFFADVEGALHGFNPSRRPQTPRRPPGPVPLPRPAQPLTRSCVRPAREPPAELGFTGIPRVCLPGWVLPGRAMTVHPRPQVSTAGNGVVARFVTRVALAWVPRAW